MVVPCSALFFCGEFNRYHGIFVTKKATKPLSLFQKQTVLLPGFLAGARVSRVLLKFSGMRGTRAPAPEQGPNLRSMSLS